ncbi:MAG TPA: hypothetical protein ENH26_03130 [Candidatus Wolfebacteria bacterium]|nr:hypothetical protein [Candidatus Wolfebacteria bacterium]
MAFLFKRIGYFINRRFCFIKRSTIKTLQDFFYLAFAPSVWFVGNALSMINYNIANAAVFWWRFGYTGAIFIPVAYYHFYLSYFKKNNKIILYFIYAIIFFEIIYLWFFLGDIRNLYYVLPNVGLVILGISHFYYFLFFGMVKYIVISMVILISFLENLKKKKHLFLEERSLNG